MHPLSAHWWVNVRIRFQQMHKFHPLIQFSTSNQSIIWLSFLPQNKYWFSVWFKAVVQCELNEQFYHHLDRWLKMNRKILIFLLIICSKIFCQVLPKEGVKVILPDNFSPQKEAIFFQRQLIILLVPSALGAGVGGLPVGGLPYG